MAIKKDPEFENKLYSCMYCGGALDAHHQTVEDYEPYYAKIYSRKCTVCHQKNYFRTEHLGKSPKIKTIPPQQPQRAFKPKGYIEHPTTWEQKLFNLIQFDELDFERRT